MSQSKRLEQKIALIADQIGAGATPEAACRKAGISLQTYYRWRNEFGRLLPSEVVRLQSLEQEIRQLKLLVAELSLTKQLLQGSIKARL